MKTILLEMVGLQFGTKGIRKYLHLIFTATNLCVNLEPERADFLRGLFEEIKPGYHMNKDIGIRLPR